MPRNGLRPIVQNPRAVSYTHLGTALHTGIEEGVEQALDFYNVDDQNRNMDKIDTALSLIHIYHTPD